MEGILVIDKPQNITSHDVVDFVRKKFGIKRVGHSGTLDPLATGVLVILIGRYTKLFNKFVDFDKEYMATLTLGITTSTGDIQGKIIEEATCPNMLREDIIEVFKGFIGETQQIPPMVSALRFRGKRLYQLARRGIDVPRQARSIRIDKLELVNFSPPEIEFYVKCSKGTYVRRLAEEIGERLKCGGCVSKIRRISLGPFNIKEAISLDNLNESYIRLWSN